MRRAIWKDGRFSWLFVSSIAYSTVSLLLFDYTWRVVTMAFWQQLLVGFVAWAIGLAVLVIMARLLRARALGGTTVNR